MAEQQVLVPDIGGFKDVAVIEVLVKAGDTVAAEDTLVTLETDKAAMDVPSPYAGTVKEVKVKVGDKVGEGKLILVMETSGAAAAPVAAPAAPIAPAAPAAAAPVAAKPAAAPVAIATVQPAVPAGAKGHASPAIRRFARELGVDIAQVKGSGEKNRVTKEDVQNFVKQSLAQPRGAAGAGLPGLLPWPDVDFAKFGEIETKPLSRIKKISGANLHRNWVMIPHVTQFEEADISDIIRQLHKVVDKAIETKDIGAEDGTGTYDISKIDFDRLRKEFEHSPAKRTTVQNLRQAIEKRLQRLLAQNPLRTDFQQHYETIVAEYNREKDRVTIEQTFETLFQFDRSLDEEERRAVREGLDEEYLAIFDLLKKPDLSVADINRIKKVSVELLEKLKAEKLKIDHWCDKEATRDAVHTAIRDFLWDDSTGLPLGSYGEEDILAKTEEVFRHVYRVYPSLPSPIYGAMTSCQ